MIDVKTNQILGLEVTDESVQDDPLFPTLIDQASELCGVEHSIREILDDGGYDRIYVINTLEKRGISSGMKIRHNAATRFTVPRIRLNVSESAIRAEALANGLKRMDTA
jgi:hypothetical protein